MRLYKNVNYFNWTYFINDINNNHYMKYDTIHFNFYKIDGLYFKKYHEYNINKYYL